MQSTDLRTLLNSKSNFELTEIYKMGYNYDMETIEVVTEIIESRGGIDVVYENAQIEIKKMPIREHLLNQILTNLKEGKSIDEMRDQISSDVLSKDELDNVFQVAKEEFEKFSDDIKVTPKSLKNGIIGGVIGGTIGGGLFGMMLTINGDVPRLIGLVLMACSYFFVWLFSRKNVDNKATIIITLLSVFFAVVLGFIIS